MKRAAGRQRDPEAETVAATDPAASQSSPKTEKKAVAKTAAASPAEAADDVPMEVALKTNEKPTEPLTEVERRARSIANLEKIGQALAAYVAKRKQLPAAGIPRDGELLLSWRVMILPELGYPELYKRFLDTEPWDGANNRLLLDYIPPEYQSPERFDSKTNYLGVAGHGMPFTSDLDSMWSGTRLASIKDGADNTLAVVEVDDKHAQEWTRPMDHVPSLQLPADKLGSLRGEGAFGILANGRLVMLPKELAPSRLAALFTTAGGEPIGAASFLKPPTAEPPPPMLATVADDPTLANQGQALEAGAADAAATDPGAVAGGPALLPGSAPFLPDPAKEPVPDEESLAKARELLKELYAEDYRQARTPQTQEQFLQKLQTDVPNVEDSPADFYELLRIVRDLAAALGDLTQALAACELLEQRFQIDPLATRLQVLQTLSKGSNPAKNLQAALQEVRRIEREAIAADRYEIALPAHEVWISLARIEGNKADLARLGQQADALAAAKSLHALAQRALASLSKNPDDAAANEAVGTYLCLVKSRWEAGLPYLARSGDIRLRGIASLEMAANRSLGETLSLAEQCWDLAVRFKQPQRRGLHLRAVYYYGLVKAKGAAGLETVKAQRRIDEAAALYGGEEISRILAPLAPLEQRGGAEDLSAR